MLRMRLDPVRYIYEKLAVLVHAFQGTQNLVVSRCCFSEDSKEMYKDL